MAKDKFVEKITIEYNNGEKQEIGKGFVVEFSKKENSIENHYNMCNISGKELELVISSILKLGTVLGMFD